MAVSKDDKVHDKPKGNSFIVSFHFPNNKKTITDIVRSLYYFYTHKVFKALSQTHIIIDFKFYFDFVFAVLDPHVQLLD